MDDEVLIQVRFSREYNGLVFNDALYYTFEEWDAASDQEVLDAEDARFNAWVALITAPATEQGE